MLNLVEKAASVEELLESVVPAVEMVPVQDNMETCSGINDDKNATNVEPLHADDASDGSEQPIIDDEIAPLSVKPDSNGCTLSSGDYLSETEKLNLKVPMQTDDKIDDVTTKSLETSNISEETGIAESASAAGSAELASADGVAWLTSTDIGENGNCTEDITSNVSSICTPRKGSGEVAGVNETTVPLSPSKFFSRSKVSTAPASKYRLMCQCGAKNCRKYLY